MSEETVTITKKEYDRLLADSRFLECLEAGGVDNWDWYSEACAQLCESYPEYCEDDE
jgi:hypothetical protein